MSARRLAGALLSIALLMDAAPARPQSPAAGRLASTRVLAQRLVENGRGEAAVTLTLEDPMGGPPRILRGRLALEPPGRVRLDFTTGECIAVRGDGGEWLQPAQRQMIRLASRQSGFASWLWDLFLAGGQGRFRERSAGARRFVLVAAEASGGLPDTLGITVDARGLPAELEIRDQSLGRTLYRFSRWRFAAPRGSSWFTLHAPVGFTVVEEAEGMDPGRR